MSSIEPALRAVRSQVQFELTEVAAQVAQASDRTERAQSEMSVCKHRCLAAAEGLRTATGRARINPPLLQAMSRIHHSEQLLLRQCEEQLSFAQREEEQARNRLAELRNRERSLDRALLAERRKRKLKEQAIEMIVADDLWLQHAWRTAQ